MPRKKKYDDLKLREARLRDEMLHIYRAIARDKRAPASIRLISADRSSVILGLLEKRVLELGVRHRQPPESNVAKHVDGVPEELDVEKDLIREWHRQRGEANVNAPTSTEAVRPEVQCDGSPDESV